MDGETSNGSQCTTFFLRAEPISEDNNQEDENRSVALDTVLPNDILEKIFSFLPVVSIIRAGAVSKRWYGVVHSRRYSWISKEPQKPWYFMFTSSEAVSGYAYDPSSRKWYNFDFPCIERDNWFISSSCGLVCFMDYDNRNRFFICNPITKDWKQLQEPTGARSPDYSTLALSVNRKSHCYTVALVKSKQVPDDFFQWDFSIQIYESESNMWVASIREVLMGWRGGDEGVICDGILYCLIYSFMGNEPRHGLIMYDLSSGSSSHTSLMCTVIPVPFSLTCGRLMNLKDRLIMVGGLGKPERSDIIKGIGIWELDKREWKEIARMPHKFFQGFGELDDVLASSGTEDLIYIQSFGSPLLLTFDMTHKQWRWSVRCPVTKKFPLQLFSGFCFEPRLEVAP